MLVHDILSEASTPRRAWNGKLAKIDALLSWMYEKDILTKGDKAKKDTVFYQYYRFYNDGDLPAALRSKGWSKRDMEHPSYKPKIEKALEEYLETFIKSMLAKYLPRVDRAEFRLDKMMSDLKTVISVSERYDSHALLTYWLKKVNIKDPGSALKGMVDRLQKQHDALEAAVNKVSKETSNIVTSYRREQLKKSKEWTPAFEEAWNEMTGTMDEITEFLENLVSSIKRLKAAKLSSKEE